MVGYLREAYSHKRQLLQDVLGAWFVLFLAYASVIGLVISQLARLRVKPVDGQSFIIESGLSWVLLAWSYWGLVAVGPIFFVTFPLMNPRMLWFCQSVALVISAFVAPFPSSTKAA
jgi:hypothetical protein